MFVKHSILALSLVASATLAAPSLADDSAKISDPTFLSSLETIERTAVDIANGKAGTGDRLSTPVRTITVAWDKAASILSKDGSYIVEMKQANTPITAFVNDWKTTKDPRGEANEITGALADLYDLTLSQVPSDVHRVAYLDRKIALDAQQQRWSDASGAADDLAKTWSNLRGEIAKRPDRANAAQRLDRAVRSETSAAKQRDAATVASAQSQAEAAVRAIDPQL